MSFSQKLASLRTSLKRIFNHFRNTTSHVPTCSTPTKCNVGHRKLNTPEKKKFKTRQLKTICKAKKRLLDANTKLKDEIRKYEEKLRTLTDERIEDLIKRLKIGDAQAMVLKEILSVARFTSKHGRRYSGDWLLTCLLMHIRSPGMYKFILQNGILPLPDPRTIKRRISSIKIECGFDECFLEAMKKKMETKTEQEKHGVLIFDEVSVRKGLKTDVRSMRYQGVVNFGDTDSSTECSTEKDDLADHVLVFGFSSIMEDYFQPVGCFAVKGATNGVTLSKLVLQAIILLEQVGAKITGIICDGAKPNRRMWKELGVCGKLGSMRNYFQNPYDDERKVFCVFRRPTPVQMHSKSLNET